LRKIKKREGELIANSQGKTSEIKNKKSRGFSLERWKKLKKRVSC
jgi:hypothetical protein